LRGKFMDMLRKNLTKAGNPLILKIWLGGLDFHC
jgi:hypothetical protein